MKTKKRVVLKKGRKVTTKQGNFVISLSKKVYSWLKPFSKKIEIAGSIRRKLPNPIDIDIVLIPKDKEKIVKFMKTKGTYMQGGKKRVVFKIKGVKTEIYYADSKSWGASLFAYTGPSGYSIGLRKIAKLKGYLLNQYGLFHRNNGYIAGKTEKSVYKALGKKFKNPELRK